MIFMDSFIYSFSRGDERCKFWVKIAFKKDLIELMILSRCDDTVLITTDKWNILWNYRSLW